MASESDALRKAQALIAQQTQELERLREHVGSPLETSAILSRLALPTDLLDTIVDAAAQVIGARSAALFLVDADELTFAVATGPAADRVLGLRLPIGHGIAGLVARSGEPMIVADASADARQAADIAAEAEYHPESLLCVPLIADQEVIGVLELLDKANGDGFTMADMASLAQFARVAVIVLVQMKQQTALQQQFDKQQDPAVAPGGSPDLWGLVSRIAAHGEREAASCEAMLRVFARYLEPETS